MKVIFRILDDEVIALFPEEIYTHSGFITSYMHIGQHGGASPDLVTNLPAATADQYSALLTELASIGYSDLDVEA